MKDNEYHNSIETTIFAFDPPSHWKKGFFVINNGDLPNFIFEYEHLPLEYKTLYEVINGFQKPHFDIDSNTMIESSNILLNALIKAIGDILIETGIDYKPENCLYIFSSRGPNKRSFHVIVTGWYHVNKYEAEAFYNLCKNRINIPPGVSLDGNVYKINQQFRLFGSSKKDANRPKILEKDIIYNENSALDEWTHKLVGWFHNCNQLPSFL